MTAAKVTADSNGKAESHILTAEAILAAKDLKEEIIEVPEWGGSVKVRSFTKKKQQEIRSRATIDDEIDTDRLEMFLFINGVIDPEFSEDQYELLCDKSAGAIDSVLNKIMELSGMTVEQQQRNERKFQVRS